MRSIVIVCGYILLVPSILMCDPKKMVVNVDIADLRSRPEPIQEGLIGPAYSKDIGAQDSQVFFGESIMGEEIHGNPEWVKVSTQTQKNWNGQNWVSYPGFILRSCLKDVSEFPKYTIVLHNAWAPLYASRDQKSPSKFLSLGTRLEAYKISPDWWKVMIDNTICGYLKSSDGIYELTTTIQETEQELREKIVQAAHLLLNPQTPYVWGGRSPLREGLTTQITGIDCSGLTQLSYLAGAGLEIPRDSGPQYRAAHELLSGKDLKKADLIFFARQDALRFTHVMMYVDDGNMIESLGEGGSRVAEALEKGFSRQAMGTRKIDVKTAIGVEVDKIESGITLSKQGYRVLLASYFGTNSKANTLRAVALMRQLTYS